MNAHQHSSVSQLLLRVGIEPVGFSCTPIVGGANNRVYKLDTEEGPFFLKEYYQHACDHRDRLDSEYRFCQFTRSIGVNSTPALLAHDRQSGLALFEWVEGRMLDATEINQNRIQEAIDFFVALNEKQDEAQSFKLPSASEACFRCEDHLNIVETRLKRFHEVEQQGQLTKELSEFLNRKLEPTWTRLRNDATKALMKLGQPMSSLTGQICLSPSDFGFHNAIVNESDQLRFIDFEYAGWDSTAKVICDFFCQPQRPVNIQYLDKFIHGITISDWSQEYHMELCRVLLPVQEFKWCLISLSELLPSKARRRLFSKGESLQQAERAAKLEFVAEKLRPS